MKLVFKTRNNHSVFSYWNKQSGHAVFNKAGICTGMVVVWIKKSIASEGRGLKEFGDTDIKISSIIQASFTWKHLFPSKGLPYPDGIPILLQNQELISLRSTFGQMTVDRERIAEWMLEKTGHFILMFFSKDGENSLYNGHSIGFRNENSVLEQFDPNLGLFWYDNIEQFKSYIAARLSVVYSGLDGNWYLHNVGLDT